MNAILDSQTKDLFTIKRVSIGTGGAYLAVRASDPSFALIGETIIEACLKAERVLDMYDESKIYLNARSVDRDEN